MLAQLSLLILYKTTLQKHQKAAITLTSWVSSSTNQWYLIHSYALILIHLCITYQTVLLHLEYVPTWITIRFISTLPCLWPVRWGNYTPWVFVLPDCTFKRATSCELAFIIVSSNVSVHITIHGQTIITIWKYMQACGTWWLATLVI